MSEFAGGAGIVGAIEVNVRAGVQFFEAAGPDRVGDSTRDRIIGDLKAAVPEEPRGNGREGSERFRRSSLSPFQ